MGVGIRGWGVYVPIYRLDCSEITAFWKTPPVKGLKAVRGWDEDTITMGVEAARECLKVVDRMPRFVICASTTFPYGEKQSATLIASALNLPDEIVTFDIASSIRGGTIALSLALKLCAEGDVLIVASDSRLPYPGSPLETVVGDGAVAILVGEEDPYIEIEDTLTISSTFFDVWRKWGEEFLHASGQRFVLEEGVMPLVREVLNRLKEKGHHFEAFDRIILHGPSQREVDFVVRSLGLDRNKVCETLYPEIGNIGVAAPILMILNEAETAKEGERCLAVFYGDGIDAFIVRIWNRPKVGCYIADRLNKRKVISYPDYLRWRRLLPIEPTMLWERPRPSIQRRWRERKTIYMLSGYKCKKCQTVQVHPQGQHIRVCVKCKEKDNFESFPLSSEKGVLYTYTIDYLQFTLNPPGANGVVDFTKGGRLLCELTDFEPSSLKVGMPVEMTFRVLDADTNIINYFWKAKPREIS